MNKKTLIIVAAKVLLTLFAFYVISKRVTLNPFNYFTKDSLNYFLIAIGLSLFLVLVQALRWKHIVKVFSVDVPYQKCLIAVWAGHLINNILPTATAGDLLRSYTLRYADKEKKWRWLGAFLAEKYSAATSALLVACLTAIFALAAQLPPLFIVLLSGLLICLLLAPIIGRKLPLPNRLIFVHKINKTLSYTFLNNHGRRAFIDSFCINLIMCIVFYMIGNGLGAPLKLSECLFVVPVFTILASLPISYAGWGVRELSCVGLLQFFGVPAESAVIISVMYGLILLLSSLPGILVVYHFIAARRQLIGQREEPVCA